MPDTGSVDTNRLAKITLAEFASSARLDLPENLLSALAEKGVHTLEDVRKVGDIAHLENLPGADSSAVRALEAQANLSILSSDVGLNAKLIDKGFTNVSAIANTSRADFVAAVQDELGDFKAAQIHDMAIAQTKFLDNVLAGLRADRANGFATRNGLTPRLLGSRDCDLRHPHDLSGASVTCECKDCQAATSPLAYLADLLAYAMKHLQSSIGTTAPSPSTGTGLYGEYYNNVDLTDLKLTRTDPTVDFDWSANPPDPSIDPDTFSVRWSGQVQPKYSETYTFTTYSDDGVRLWVNDQLIIDNWTDHASTPNSGTIQLLSGRGYNLKMEYYQNHGAAVARLLWSSPSQQEEVIPTSQLYPFGVDLQFLADLVHQPFGRLLASCESVDKQVSQVRICSEVLRSYLSANQPTAERADALSKAEADYCLAAYQALLNGVGTSYDEIRLARGAEPKERQALADRLGIDLGPTWPGPLEALFLDPNQGQVTEAELEQLFGLVDTTRDPLDDGPTPELEAWRKKHLRTVWHDEDWPEDLSGEALLFVDPDVVTIDDLRYPVDGQGTFDLWKKRRAWVDEQLANFRKMITKWGSPGSGDGQFEAPFGVAVDSSGDVYVVDSGNYRIQKFDSEGNFLKKWGSQGSGDGQFEAPSGVAVDGSGDVYVSDFGNYRIQKFDSEGNFLKKWGSQGSGDEQFGGPSGVAVDSSGNVYVADSGDVGIQKFDSEGNFLKKWGSLGSGDGQLFNPSAVAVDSSGNVYVADFSRRIQKFGSEGSFLKKWGSLGNDDGQFIDPSGIAVDGSGYIYIADSGNSRIQKFDSDGQLVPNLEQMLQSMRQPVVYNGTPSSTPPWAPTTQGTGYFDSLRDQLQSGANIEAIRQQIGRDLNLTIDAFSRLMAIRDKDGQAHSADPKMGKVGNDEWGEVYSILTQAQKESLFSVWQNEEKQQGIVLGPEVFWSSLREPTEGDWPPAQPAGRPLIDPEILGKEDLTEALAGQIARATWLARRDALDQLKEALKAEHLAHGFDAMFRMALGDPNPGDPLPDDPERLESNLRNNVDVDETKRIIEENFYMTVEAFGQLMAVRVKDKSTDAATGPTASELEGVYAIFTSAEKEKREFPGWFQEEASLQLDYWRLLKAKLPRWRAEPEARQAWQQRLKICGGSPIVDPHIIVPADIKNPTPGDPAYDIWKERDQWVGDQRTSLENEHAAQHAPLMKFDAVLIDALFGTPIIAGISKDLKAVREALGLDALLKNVLGDPLLDLDGLLANLTNGTDPEEPQKTITQSLYLTLDDFNQLMDVRRKVAENQSVSSSEWDAVYTMLTRAELVGSVISLGDGTNKGSEQAVSLDQLGLSAEALSYLRRIRILAAIDQPVLPAEWYDVDSILIQAQKQLTFGEWREEEKQQGLLRGPDSFQIPPSDPTEFPPKEAFSPPEWLGTSQARSDWQDTLQSRIDQDQSITDDLDAVVSATEETTLPMLRDALILATGAGGTDLDEKGAWLTERLLIDTRVDGCQKTTRIVQAIETLQSLLLSVHTGQFPNLIASTQPITLASGWTHIVPVYLDKEYLVLLFYNSSSGDLEFYTTGGQGDLTLLRQQPGWKSGWTHMVPGVFHQPYAGFSDLLFYEPVW